MTGWANPTIWTDGTSITAVSLNKDIRDNFIALLRPVGIKDDLASFGASLPNPISGIQIQAGRDPYTTDSNHQIHIVYPVPFPHATISCLVTDVGGTGTISYHPDPDLTTNSYIAFWAWNANINSYLAGPAIVNVCWIAFGF